MQIVSIAAGQIFTMFVIIVIAVVCYKKNLINEEGNKVLSNLLLYLINPCIMFCSYQKAFDLELVKGLALSFLLALASHVLSMLVAFVFIRGQHVDVINERMATIYTNCGFLAIPLVNKIYGYDGVFYLTSYITVFDLLIWTHGVIYMGGRGNIKEAFKALRSPAILSIVCGLVCYFAGIILPKYIISPLEYLGDMNTPVAMMIAGACIAQTDLRKLLFKPRIYLVSLLKLLIVPVLFILIFKPFFGEGIVMGVLTIATASPVATMCMIFAIRYDQDSHYASELFAVTTMFSLVTIPLVLFLLHIIPW